MGLCVLSLLCLVKENKMFPSVFRSVYFDDVLSKSIKCKCFDSV